MNRSGLITVSRTHSRQSLLGLLVCALVQPASCTRRLEIDVTLIVPERPDPFEGVARVRVRALASGRVVSVGEGRWDQGPLAFPTEVDPEVERVVVEGLSADGRVLSSAQSAALDLLRRPPEGPIAMLFSRIGELSVLHEQGGFRRGGRALQLSDERVLFVGGTGEDGCPIETTEVFDAADRVARPGPPLAGGRLGAFHALTVPDGRVVVVSGEVAVDCGDRAPAKQIAVLDPHANTTVLSEREIEAAYDGSSAVAVSNTLVLIAGGDEGGGVVSEAVFRFNPRTLEFQSPGRLGHPPRAESAVSLVPGQRVVFIGGRSSASDDSALDSASVFDPSGGVSSLSSLAPPPRGPSDPAETEAFAIAPAARATSAGSVIFAGGRDRTGRARAAVSAFVAESGSARIFGDTSTVAELGAPVGSGELIDLTDGTLLLVPRGDEPLTWISLLPAGSSVIPRLEGAGGPLIGGRAVDGTAILRSEGGRYLVFNPGPRAALGTPELVRLLSMPRGVANSGAAVGAVPLRPSAWTLSGTELRGRVLPTLSAGGVVPSEVIVLGNSALGDFDATFTVELQPLSQAAFMFGLRDGEFDQVAFLGGSTLLLELRLQREARSTSVCNVQTPAFSSARKHRVRVERSGDDVRVDIDDDGSSELACRTSRAEEGHVAFGVIAGSAVFGEVSISVDGTRRGAR